MGKSGLCIQSANGQDSSDLQGGNEMTTYYLVDPISGKAACGEYTDLAEAKKAAKACGTVYSSDLRRIVVSKPWVCVKEPADNSDGWVFAWVYRPRE